jgi:hypothetical protein
MQITKDRLETIYKRLLEESKMSTIFTVENERADAKLCLIEELLEEMEEEA